MGKAGQTMRRVADDAVLPEPFSVETVRARIGLALEGGHLLAENHDDRNSATDRLAPQEGWLGELFFVGVQSPSSAPESRDCYTPGHSVRVSAYAGAIARALQLDDETIRQIELGGYVHDLGKIGVREDVLNKPGPLTRKEYEHIMIHPVVGWQILAPLLGGAPIVLNIVRSHHERMDGQGVPDQLHGKAIPLEARIATIADALDAMTSARPYRRSELTLDGAMGELRRHEGDQFDRDIVEAVLQAAATGDLALIPRTAAVT